MKFVNNYGILTAISWNSKSWKAEPTEKDLKYSQFGYVKENHSMWESLNFAHDILPAEKDGSFIAYSPMFNRLPSVENSKRLKVIFFRSLNYMLKRSYVVGLYYQPKLYNFFERHAKHPLFVENYSQGNIKAAVSNILLFEHFLEISDELDALHNYIPRENSLSIRGFNYLHSDNVLNILNKVNLLNPNDNKLKRIYTNILSDLK